MDEINQVYESPKFDMKKMFLLLGATGVLGFAMFMTFLIQSNKENLSVHPSRAEQAIPTRKPTVIEPTRAQVEQHTPINNKDDIDSALKEIDDSGKVINEIEKSVRTLTPDSF